MGDFNVHHIEWLNSNTTDVGGREAFEFFISHELEQIIKHPTRVPDCLGDRANILNLFFTSNPQNYTYAILPPTRSSNHVLVNVSCSFARPPPLPPTRRPLPANPTLPPSPTTMHSPPPYPSLRAPGHASSVLLLSPSSQQKNISSSPPGRGPQSPL